MCGDRRASVLSRGKWSDPCYYEAVGTSSSRGKEHEAASGIRMRDPVVQSEHGVCGFCERASREDHVRS
ncbi:protein of unknown function (plasmid) [Caballeronia sp. S22]